MKLSYLFFIVFFVSTITWADDHDPNKKEFFSGSDFSFTKINGIIVGTVGVIPVWAEKVCGSHIKGIYKKEKNINKFSVEVVDKKLVGNFGEKNTLVFSKMDKENQIIHLLNDKEEILIRFSAESFSNNHFNNITFSFTNGEKEYSIFLKNYFRA